MTNEVSIKKLILVPAVITLAVTLLRLTGELMHWSKALFNPAAGGGGAIVGIAWLVPVMWRWWSLPTGLVAERPDVPAPLINLLLLMAAGVFLSGVRDLYATFGLPYGSWPWSKADHQV